MGDGLEYFLANALNSSSEHRITNWIVLRRARSRFWKARRSAGWIIQEQLVPSARLLECALLLLRDRELRVRYWPAQALTFYSDRLRLEDLLEALPYVEEIPESEWGDEPALGAARKHETVRFLQDRARGYVTSPPIESDASRRLTAAELEEVASMALARELVGRNQMQIATDGAGEPRLVVTQPQRDGTDFVVEVGADAIVRGRNGFRFQVLEDDLGDLVSPASIAFCDSLDYGYFVTGNDDRPCSHIRTHVDGPLGGDAEDSGERLADRA